MKIIETQGNILKLEDKYIVHCVSQDFKLVKAISKDLDTKYKLKQYLLSHNFVGIKCILVSKVFNLVTKEKYWHKPTLETITLALLELKEKVLANGIKEVYMPRIACGLVRQNWKDIKELLELVFEGIDIIINVYSL